MLSHASFPRYSLTKNRGRYRYLHPEQINASPTPLMNDSVVNPISSSPLISQASKSNLLKLNPQPYCSRSATPVPQKRILKSERCQHLEGGVTLRSRALSLVIHELYHLSSDPQTHRFIRPTKFLEILPSIPCWIPSFRPISPCRWFRCEIHGKRFYDPQVLEVFMVFNSGG